MKKTIEIECPDGYKPIYNAETGNVEIVPENIMGRIRTYEDAVNYLGCVTRDTIYYNRSVNSLAKLQTVLDALNEGHKFNLLTGTIWYPWVRFFRMKSVPKDAEVIGHFRYQGEKFALVGGCAHRGGIAEGPPAPALTHRGPSTQARLSPALYLATWAEAQRRRRAASGGAGF